MNTKTTFMFTLRLMAAFATIPILLACSADDSAEVSDEGSPPDTAGEAGAGGEGLRGGSSPVPKGGDTPNPGGPTSTFIAPGIFGYECIPHPSEMNGAIEVVP